MIDIHSHIIYDVDDGPSTIRDSICMVLDAGKLGINTIVATPHYNKALYDDYYVSHNFKELTSRVKDCNIDLYCGYEVFLTKDTAYDISENSDLTLNKSRYLLFELPFDNIPEYTRSVLRTLNFNNFTPILAHPERYRKFIKNFSEFISIVELGCLIQIDAASIIGVYGNEVKKFAKKLLKLDMVHCVASDAHCSSDYLNWYIPAYEQVKAWAGREKADELFNLNPKLIIENSSMNGDV